MSVMASDFFVLGVCVALVLSPHSLDRGVWWLLVLLDLGRVVHCEKIVCQCV